MTGHARALDLAGAAPAFRLDADEARELAAHLRECPECARTAARMRTDASAIGAIDPAVSPRLHDRLQEVAVSAPRSGPQALGIVLALVLLAAGVVGASIGVGALVAPRVAVAPSPALAAEPGDVVAWSTDVAQLRAGSFGIEANGRVFAAPGGADVTSDPGNLEAWTLETRWRDAGVEQAMTLYFAADKTHWWVPELWVRDGPRRPGRQGRLGDVQGRRGEDAARATVPRRHRPRRHRRDRSGQGPSRGRPNRGAPERPDQRADR